jgi:hydrogenase expression/formation protein HypC
MCLGVPGQIVDRKETRADELATALVAFGGLTRPVCVALVPEAGPGDYVLVHAGLALEKIDEDHASELLAHLRAINDGDMAELMGEATAEK